MNKTPKLGRVKRRLRAVGRVVLSGEHLYTKADWGPNPHQASPECIEEYLRFLEEWEARGRKPRTLGRTPGSPKTMGDLVDAYLRHMEKLGRYQREGKETSTWQAWRRSGDTMKDSFGAVPIRKFSRVHLMNYRDTMEAWVAAGKQIPETANQKLSRFRTFIKWAVAREYLPDTIGTAVANVNSVKSHHHQDVVQARKKKKRPVSWEDVEAVAQCSNDVYAAMLRVQRTVGCRPGELCMMNVKDIQDLGDGWWKWVPHLHKTSYRGARLTYWLNEKAVALLQPWVAKTEDWVWNYAAVKEVLGRRHRKEPNDPNGPIMRETYRRALVSGCARANIEYFSPHEIRHAVATERANDPRLSLVAAGRSLGHSNIHSLQPYVHVDEAAAKEASRAR